MELVSPIVPQNVKNGQILSHGDDRTVHAVFSEEFVKNELKSADAGRPIFDHFIQVSLEYPGNHLTTFVYRFTQEEAKKGNQWTERFPRQWAAFCAQKEQAPDGTPIEMWAFLDKRRALELKAMKFHTIEQIANIDDINGANLGLDWRKLRDQARATLNPDVSASTISKLNSEVEKLRNELDAMRNSGQVEEPAKRRGRQPKETPTQAA